MLKKTVTYENFDGEMTTETLYFNLTKTELSENIDLKERFEELQTVFDEEKRDLSAVEVKMLLDLVKTVMRLSYGVRSEDGRRFAKNDDIWTEFTQTAVYDTFLFSLFENPEECISFMLNILPKDIRPEVQAHMDAAQAKQPVEVSPALQSVPDDNRPAYLRENREPNQKELVSMSHEELIEAFRRKNQNN